MKTLHPGMAFGVDAVPTGGITMGRQGFSREGRGRNHELPSVRFSGTWLSVLVEVAVSMRKEENAQR